MQAAMKPQILAPRTRPQRGVKDFAEGHRQPVQELGLAPAASDPFHPIRHPAERRLGDVRRERDPLLMVQPVIEKRQRLPREVQKARSRFRITALRQRRQQLAEAAPDRSRELPHHSTNINIKGNSYRLREKVKPGLIREPEAEQN